MTDTPNSAPRTRPCLVAAITAITVVYLVLIWFTPSWLTGTPEYKWPVLHHGSWSRLPWAAAMLAIGVGWWALLIKDADRMLKERGGRARLYASLFLLGLVFQLGPAAVHRMGLIEYPLRVYLPDHTSYFTDAAKIEQLRPWLKSYPEHIVEFATHTRTHPPGAALLFYAAQKKMQLFPGLSAAYVRMMPRSDEAMTTFNLSPSQTAAGGLMAAGLLIVAAAMVPLTFALGRIITTDRRALFAAALFAAAPAFSIKTPILDHLLAGLVLTALWLAVTAVTKKQIWRVAAAGAVIGAGLWLGTALLSAFPLIACYIPAAIHQNRHDQSSWRERVVLGACLLLLLAGVALIVVTGLGLCLGVEYAHVYEAVTRMGWDYNNRVSGRVHAWMWVAFNPYEMLAWAGAPLAGLFAWAMLRPARERSLPPSPDAVPWALALAAFLIALDFSGKVCYESSRLAWFCFPLMAIMAATAAPMPDKPKGMTVIVLVLALQAVSTLAFRMIF